MSNRTPDNGSTAEFAGRGSSTSSTLHSDRATIATILARAITLASIVYATWHFGSADTTALRNLSLGLGAAVIVALSSRQVRQFKPRRLPIVYFSLILIWIAYGALQWTTIAGWMPVLFPGVSQVQQQWGNESVAQLGGAIEALGGSRPVAEVQPTASVNSELTRQSLVPFLLAGAAAVLSAVLFTTRKARLVFLWTVIGNAAALAFWGIIQRASRADEILPGMENTFSSWLPFGSFIYKNAGAAALLPALAGIVALAYRQRGSGDRSSSRRERQWATRSSILETKNLVLFSLGILLIVGLATSLSRGAWVAASLATLVVIPLCGIRIRKREHWIIAAIAVVAVIGMMTLAGVREKIREHRETNVSIERIAGDSRWPQWVDGFSTALTHFPSGSGLGTYGYAVLPNLSSARRGWFRQAHNQYLEVWTESGVIGIAILFTGIAWFALTSWRLRSRRNDRERRSWGILGIALIVCGGVQSIVDFVLVIPANLILYASLIGIIGAITEASRRRSDSPDGAAAGRPSFALAPGIRRFWNLPAVWCGLALLFVSFAYRASSQQRLSEQVLASSSVTLTDERPDDVTVSTMIARLSDAIAQQPHNSDLYLRRANWHLAAYRLELMEEASRDGVPIDWANTRLENLFALLFSKGGDDQAALIAGMRRTAQLKSSLADAGSDLSTALSIAPLSPRGHLTGCILSPLLEMPAKPWLESSATLVNNSSELLFLNGLLSFHCDETELAVDQWSKSLSLGHRYVGPIIELSRQKLPLMRVATELVPANRPAYYVRLLQLDQMDQSNAAADGQAGLDRALIESLVDHIRRNELIQPGDKHATIARIWRLLGDVDAELHAWESALKAEARDPNYRLEYSQVLSQLGRNDEALEQAILGKTLNPSDGRFERLTSRIRQAMRRQTRR